jgi:peptidoglycan/xylan/chitin deacetylase (PgdA/CDA1 family)
MARSAFVLLYHRVARVDSDRHALAVTPEAFRSQLEHLRRSWRVVALPELAAAAAAGDPPPRTVALAFDDGYLDNLEIAAPMLSELDLPATFFLTTEPRARDRRFWWDVLEEWLQRTGDRAAHDALYAQLKASSPVVRDDLLTRLAADASIPLTSARQRALRPDEVRRLLDFPLIGIGAHGVHHLSLPLLSPEDCYREIFESRSALERLTGTEVTSFAYPYGDVSPEAIEFVAAAGFSVAVSCDERAVRAREHRLRLPRLAAREESGDALHARLLGAAAVTG